MTLPKIVISQPWGGLGDNLAFSTLPQLYVEMGYDVYISSRNSVRNKESYDLVWGMNPYIKGVSDLAPNAGSCKGFKSITLNPMKNMELAHGLTAGNNEYPHIYYQPKIRDELKDCLLFDMTSISSTYSDKCIKDNFLEIFNKHPTLIKKKIVFSKISNRDTPCFDTDTIVVNDIYEYCDIINSCAVFVCTFSGQAVLASAIKKNKKVPEVYSIHKHVDVMNKGLMYFFNNINYVYVTDSTR